MPKVDDGLVVEHEFTALNDLLELSFEWIWR